MLLGYLAIYTTRYVRFFLKAFLQQADGVAEFVAGVQVVVAQLFKPFALALDFGLDELAGEGQAEGVVQAEAHLGDAAARVVVGRLSMRLGRACLPERMTTPAPPSPSLPSRLASRVTLPRKKTRVMGARGTAPMRWPFSRKTRAPASS